MATGDMGADTSLRLQGRSIGFSARVEPFWFHFENLKSKLKFFQYFIQKQKVKRTLRKINEGLKCQNVKPGDWDRVGGEPACHLKVAKLGVLHDLRDYCAHHLPAAVVAKSPHFLQHRDWQSYYIPVEFPTPFSIRGDAKGSLIPVGSSIRLRKEIDEINRLLRFDRSMDVSKMVAHLEVSERDILKYETTSDCLADFWIKFGWVIIKKLADLSVEKKMPVIFG